LVLENNLFSSLELKDQVSFSDRPLSDVCLPVSLSVCLSVCPSVCLSVCKLYIFDISRITWPDLSSFCTNHSWVEGIQVCPHKGGSSSPRRDNRERVKIQWQILKTFFSRTSIPNSIKVVRNYSWMKEILVCSNEGPNLLQMGV
jgi:hypothetical protein